MVIEVGLKNTYFKFIYKITVNLDIPVVWKNHVTNYPNSARIDNL